VAIERFNNSQLLKPKPNWHALRNVLHRKEYNKTMNNALKSLENNALAALSSRAPTHVTQAIKTAASKTGVSFSYLMEKAAAESSFNPTVKAKTSSATGLFQFIESTWMDMMNKHGAKHGIDTNQDKQSLLNLRKNPAIASMMAAEFASDNKAHLEQTVKRDIGETEMYFAHFMGAGGASAFLNQLEKNPNNTAADIFPKAANANRNVFYDSKTGEARSLQEVYNFFDKKFTSGETQMADAADVVDTPLRKKSPKQGQGYQHIPFSRQQPITILPLQQSGINNVRPTEMEAFFGQRTNQFTSQRTGQTNSVFPLDFYSKITDPSALLLSILR